MEAWLNKSAIMWWVIVFRNCRAWCIDEFDQLRFKFKSTVGTSKWLLEFDTAVRYHDDCHDYQRCAWSPCRFAWWMSWVLTLLRCYNTKWKSQSPSNSQPACGSIKWKLHCCPCSIWLWLEWLLNAINQTAVLSLFVKVKFVRKSPKCWQDCPESCRYAAAAWGDFCSPACIKYAHFLKNICPRISWDPAEIHWRIGPTVIVIERDSVM